MFLKYGDVIIHSGNIGFLKEKDNKFFCMYRKKASVKEIEVPIRFNGIDKGPFFMKLGFYKLDTYWINPKAINFIKTTKIKDSSHNIHFSFLNGLEIEIVMDIGRFRAWSDNRIRN